MRKLIFSIIICSFISSCYYDNSEELHPFSGLNTTCDTTTTISFSTNILPIFLDNCNGSTCHSSNAASAGIVLNNYATISSINNNLLLGVIKHEPGYTAMPQGGSKLSDCSITLIQKWIENAKPNN